MPGVQTMLSVMLNHVNNKKLTLEKLVKLMSENPCKIYEIKNKGFIEIGFDADITIVDLNKKTLIRNEDIISKCKWTPYNGMTLQGAPLATIINGIIKMYNNKIIGLPNGKVINFN